MRVRVTSRTKQPRGEAKDFDGLRLIEGEGRGEVFSGRWWQCATRDSQFKELPSNGQLSTCQNTAKQRHAGALDSRVYTRTQQPRARFKCTHALRHAYTRQRTPLFFFRENHRGNTSAHCEPLPSARQALTKHIRSSASRAVSVNPGLRVGVGGGIFSGGGPLWLCVDSRVLTKGRSGWG